MIGAAIFDVGGVLSRFGSKVNHQRWEGLLGLEPDSLGEHVFGGASAQAAYLGQIPEETHWRKVGQQLGLSDQQVEQMKRELYGDFAWDLELLEYIRTLRPCYKTAVISGAFANARAEISPWVNHGIFDCLVFSAEEGINKPDPEIYRRTLERLQVAAKHSVFIDDRLEHVEGARQIGMYGIWFENPKQLQADLSALL